MLDIESIFSYHPASDEEVAKAHQSIRNECLMAAEVFVNLIPDSPERTLAIRALQQAMMWGNSAIAQYGVKNETGSN